MTEPNLVLVCTIAFAVVFVLLFLLALVIQALALLFPEHEETDPAVLCATIQAAVTATHPGARVTRIEETR